MYEKLLSQLMSLHGTYRWCIQWDFLVSFTTVKIHSWENDRNYLNLQCGRTKNLHLSKMPCRYNLGRKRYKKNTDFLSHSSHITCQEKNKIFSHLFARRTAGEIGKNGNECRKPCQGMTISKFIIYFVERLQVHRIIQLHIFIYLVLLHNFTLTKFLKPDFF